MARDPSKRSVSRRGLLSLAWVRQPTRPPLGPWRAVLRERWDGAAALLAGLAPPAEPLCAAAGIAPAQDVLVVAAGDGLLPAAAARRGASVAACEESGGLFAIGVARTEELDVDWDACGPEELPMFDGAFDAVIAGLGALFAPRPVRAARELLRVLAPGGRLALAVPPPGSFLAQALDLALLHEGVPAPQAWGREEVLRGRLDTAAPGVELELRELPVTVRFESEAAAWAACHGPLGIPPDRRDDFADLVTRRSLEPAGVRIDDVYTLALACRR